MHRFTNVPVSSFFETTAESCTRGHSMKLVNTHFHTDLRLYLFSHCVMSRWNILTQDIANAQVFSQQL